MSMQTDVLASVPLTASGQFTNQATSNITACRIKSIYVVPSATAGSLVIKDGGASGTTVITINTVASATQPTYMLMPGEGVLIRSSPHGTITNLGSATIFYG